MKKIQFYLNCNKIPVDWLASLIDDAGADSYYDIWCDQKYSAVYEMQHGPSHVGSLLAPLIVRGRH
jgi:hypothetical protein